MQGNTGSNNVGGEQFLKSDYRMSLQKLSGIYPKQEKILSGPYQQYFSRSEVLTIALSDLGYFFLT